jgi:hypothetical protein
MAASLHNKILIISSGVVVISLGTLITGLILGIEGAIIFPALTLIFSCCSIITIYALKIKDKNWARKSAKYSMFLLPVVVAAAVYVNFTGGLNILAIILYFFVLVLAILTMIHLFLYTDAISLTGVILLLLFIITGIFFKRQHWPMAGVIITGSSFLLSVGSFVFGIRCLFLSERINYFRNVSFYGSCALSLAILGLAFKMQHWMGAGVLVIIGLISLILGTLYILITLSSSGFIDWQPFHKKILRRILIPWAFFFFLMVSRFMVPELNALIWTPDARKIEKTTPAYGFGMRDYKIEDKNGVNPE